MTGTGVIAAMAVVSTTMAVVQAAQGPPSRPQQMMPPLPSQEPIKQAEKAADRSVADRIKATRSKMGSVATPQTMLSGTMGVGDEELNLGGKLI